MPQYMYKTGLPWMESSFARALENFSNVLASPYQWRKSRVIVDVSVENIHHYIMGTTALTSNYHSILFLVSSQ